MSFFSSALGSHVPLTPHLTAKLKTSRALARQFIPSPAEALTMPEELVDPIGDSAHTPVKGIIHRYPDRVLLMPHLICAAYCRFCFRRDKMRKSGTTLTSMELASALEYIHARPTIWEVILSGGDPLLLAPETLRDLLTALSGIPHLGVVRLHTRLPISDPWRVSESTITMLASFETLAVSKALYIVLHCNHVDELGPETTAVCRAIVRIGVPILSQTVLLQGINDTTSALAALFRALVQRRIKPYYLHHADLARGTGHFRTTLGKGQALMRALRAELSGLCQPTYVLDIPGGYGKVPVGPCYLHGNTVGEQEIEDPKGRRHFYPPRARSRGP